MTTANYGRSIFSTLFLCVLPTLTEAAMLYHFSSYVDHGEGPHRSTPSSLVFEPGTHIQGSFLYDATAPTGLVGISYTLYTSAITDFAATIAGNSFGSDYVGMAVDNGTTDSIYISPNHTGFTSTGFRGFQISTASANYELISFSLQWSGADFLDNESLPLSLPPNNVTSSIRLTFADLDTPFTGPGGVVIAPYTPQVIVANDITFTSVPIPGAALFFLSALGAVGVIRNASNPR